MYSSLFLHSYFLMLSVAEFRWGVLSRDTHSTAKDLLTSLALRRVRATEASSKVKFTVVYFPYQLYPEATQEGDIRSVAQEPWRNISGSGAANGM